MSFRSAFPTAGFDEASFGGGWVPGMGSEWPMPRAGFGSGAAESPSSMHRPYRPPSQGQERIIPITRYDGNNQSDFETESNYSGSSLASGASVGSNRSNSSSRSSGRASVPEGGRVRRVPMTVEGRSSPISTQHPGYNRPSSRSSTERTGSPNIYSSSPSQHYYPPSHPTHTPTQLGNCHAKPAEGGVNFNDQHVNQHQVDGSRGPHVTRVHLGQTAPDVGYEVPHQQQQQQQQNNMPPAQPSSVQQPPPKQKTAAEKVMCDVQDEIGRLETAVNEFDGEKGKDSKEYRYLDEMLTRCMLKLDDIDCSGRDDLRQNRKSLLGWINKCIQHLESKVKQLIPVTKTPEPAVQSSADGETNNENEAKPSIQEQPNSSDPEGQANQQQAESHNHNSEPMDTTAT